MIDWGVLRFVQEHREWRWSEDMEPESLLNRFIYDPWTGRYRYFPLKIDPDLSPSDAPPSYVPDRPGLMQNIMNYSSSLGKRSRSLFLERCNWAQPVLQVEIVCLRRNFLDRATASEKAGKRKCVICPEAVMLSAVSYAIHSDLNLHGSF
jgi:endoribonuclease Dicer